MVDKITFLYTSEFNTQIKLENEMISASTFCQMVREELENNCIETRQRVVVSYARDIPRVIMDGVREVGKENIIIDLTCGKKDITGSLYTAASISQIHNMIYIEVPRINGGFPKLNRESFQDMKDKFKLTRYESLDEIQKLASLNEMDFIFYKKNVQELRQRIANSKLESYCAQIGHVIEEYFSTNIENYRNAIRELGLINEEIMSVVGRELYDQYGDFLNGKKYNDKRSLDTIRNLEEVYQSKNTPPETKESLENVFGKTPAMFEMMETFRIYRNKASHYRNHIFSREEVKLLMDMMLLLLNNIIESGIANRIWKNEFFE